jgi:two-component system, cell cycle sensor histidine kinase and response regulator CckA
MRVEVIESGVDLTCFDGPPEVPRMPTPVPPPRDTRRVLLVEDDRAVRTIAARILRRGGYDVVEATTGREAIDAFNKVEGRVDLILTDLVLPELGGRALINALAERGPIPPVVFMSGYSVDAMGSQEMLEPGEQFLEKPFTAEALLARVREGVARSHEARRAG